MIWFLFLWVKDSTSAMYISPSMLMDLDFLANTMGTPNSLATKQAMPMPEASMVSTLVMG